MENTTDFKRREKRNFMLFSAGKFVSIFGSAIYSFAISLYVLKITGSGLSFATNVVLSMIPMIVLGPLAGVFADKLDKKKMIVFMDIINGILLVGFYIYSLNFELTIASIYITTFLMNICTTVFGITFEVSKPDIVSDEKLIKMNSVSKLVDSISGISGPMAGGVLYAFVDVKLFILVNGISFIASGISEMFIDFKLNKKEVPVTESTKEDNKIDIKKDLVEGLIYLKRADNIKSYIFIFAGLNVGICLGIQIPMPFIINNVLKLSSSAFGIIQGALPIGIIAGALIVNKIYHKLDYDKVLKLMLFLTFVSTLLIAAPVTFNDLFPSNLAIMVFLCAVMFSIGVIIAFVDIPIMTILQQSIEEKYRGRVISLTISFVKILAPLALIMSGALINVIPPDVVVAIGSSAMLLTMIGLKYFDSKKNTALEPLGESV